MPFRGLSPRPAPKCPPNLAPDRHSDGESDGAHESPLVARVRRKQRLRTVPPITTISKDGQATSSSRSTPTVSEKQRGKRRKRPLTKSSADLHPARTSGLPNGNRDDTTSEDPVVQDSRTDLHAKRRQCSEVLQRSKTTTTRGGEGISDCMEEEEDPEEFIFELARSLGLPEDLRTELTKVSHLPIEKKIIFLIASVKHRSGLFDDVPKKAVLQFDRIAENMLLTVTPETLFKDRGVNNLKFYGYLKDHWKELGLKNGWSGSMTKLRSLELASQKSFSEGRRRIIEKLAESIEQDLPLSELAVLFGRQEPSKEECGMFALLRCEFLKKGRHNFFDEVDRKLSDVRAIAPDDTTTAEFRKFRRKDAKKFPEPTCKKRKCAQKPSGDAGDATRKKRRKGAPTKT